MSQFIVQGSLDQVFKVALDKLPATWIAKERRHLDLGWNTNADSKKYLNRPPTPQEYQLFRTKLESMQVFKVQAASGVEAMIMQGDKKPSWSGTKLSVGDQEYEFKTAPHESKYTLQPYDAFAVGVATQMLKPEAGKLIPSLSTSVIEDGPLSSLMTPVSYLEYVDRAGRLLEGLQVSGKKETLAKDLYEKMAQTTSENKKAFRFLTYGLFEKAGIKVNMTTGEIQVATGYKTTENAQVEAIKHEGKTIALVPRMVPQTVSKAISIFPKKEVKDKNTLSALISHIGSRFPPNLCKFYGFRGMPVKSQMEYMLTRQLLQGNVVIVDPDETLAKWMVENGQSTFIRRGATNLALGTLTSADIVLERRDYTEPLQLVRDGIMYGTVKYSEAFWKEFKVIVYRPDPLGRVFYCPHGLDTSFLSKMWCDWELTVASTQAQLQKLYGQLAAELTTAVFSGSYLPHGKQYVDLKYPVTPKEYLEATPDALRGVYQDTGPNLDPPKGSVGPSFQLWASQLVDEDGTPSVKKGEPSNFVPAPAWQTILSPVNSSDLENYEYDPAMLKYLTFFWSIPASLVSHLPGNRLEDCPMAEYRGATYLIVGERKKYSPTVLLVLSPEGLDALRRAVHERDTVVVLGKSVVVDE